MNLSYKLYINKIIKNLLGFDQFSNYTEEDRYPVIFNYIKDNIFPKKILSFGCSTGLECKTIRGYFPSSEIIGFDLSSKNIKIAKMNSSDNHLKYYSNYMYVRFNKFDLIFAMSVLCRWPETENLLNCEKVYSFKKFENSIKKLDKLLNIEGLLVIFNSNFKFTDTKVSKRYLAINIGEYQESGFVTKFDSKNNKCNDEFYPFVLFKKIY